MKFYYFVEEISEEEGVFGSGKRGSSGVRGVEFGCLVLVSYILGGKVELGDLVIV